MPRAVKIVCFALVVAGFGFLAASCGNGNAQYRVVNAISDTSTLDPTGLVLYMNGGALGSGTPITFRQTLPSSGKYLNVQGGGDTLDVYRDAVAGEAGDWLIESTLGLSGDTQTTVVLLGNQSSQMCSGTQSGSACYAVEKYTDNNTTLPLSGNAEFRIINASAVSQPNGVDIYILPTGTTPSTPGAPKINTSGALNFPDATPYTNVGLPGGTLNVYVTPHGQTGNYAPPLAVSGLTGGTSVRTIVITDTSPGVSPLYLLELTDVN